MMVGPNCLDGGVARIAVQSSALASSTSLEKFLSMIHPLTYLMFSKAEKRSIANKKTHPRRDGRIHVQHCLLYELSAVW